MEHQFKAPCLPCVLHYLNMGEKKSRNCISNKRRYVTKLRFGCCCLFAKSCPTLLQPQGLQPTRFLCPWDFPGKNTGVVCHFLLQGIFPTQGSNQGLLHCRHIVYQLSYQGSCQFSIMDRKKTKQKQKTSKETEDLNNPMSQPDLIDIQNTLANNNRIHILLKYTWNTSQNRENIRHILRLKCHNRF